MDLNEIKKIVNNSIFPHDVQEDLIIQVLAKDNRVIPLIMEILDAERNRKNLLVTKMNLELSRAHVTLQHPEINKDKFIITEITNFYLKNKDQVGHCFMDLRNEELPPEDTDSLKLGFDN